MTECIRGGTMLVLHYSVYLQPVSHSFGYGLMDAAAMVKAARSWNSVPPQQLCEIRAPDSNK